MSRARVRTAAYRQRRYARKAARRARRGIVSNCQECYGTGHTMKMVCYGGPPHEIEEICEDCGGGSC